MKKPDKIINEIRLPDKPEQYVPITWTYNWTNRNGQVKWKHSTALQELTDLYYFEN